MTQIGRWLSSRVLPWIVTMLLACPAGAQTSSDEGDYVTEEPMACPSVLRPGYDLSPYGYPIEYGTKNYWFKNDWRAAQWGTGPSEMDYYPANRQNPLEGRTLDDEGLLYWYDAGHRQQCKKIVRRDRYGRMKSVSVRYVQIDQYGEFRLPSGTSGGGGDSEGSPPTIGGNSACIELRLDPGCYDYYVDGAYTGRICC